MKQNWTGVRPVRFRDEIFRVLDLTASRNGVSVEEMRDYILELRLDKENRREKAVQRSVTFRSSKRKRPDFLTKIEQMIRVLRKTGMVVRDDGVIRPTEKCRDLLSIKQKDRIAADAFFLESLVNSTFRTYWLYLKQLFKCKEILIPNSFSKRDAKLREYVFSAGFPLDIWSFFILRDLFYDFSLLNYVIDQTSQKVFPLYSIDKEESEDSPYEYRVRGSDAYLSFWPKPPEDFTKGLVDVYLSLTDNKWHRVVDLVVLRERYSHRFFIPERQFDIMLQKALEQENRYKIVLSVGHITYDSKSTYINKALALPYNKLGLPYSLIRIGVGEY